MAFARTVVESREAMAVIDAEIRKQPRLYDVFEGVKWRIAREPEVGYPVPGPPPQVHVLRSEEWPGIPGVLVVAYIFDHDQAEILGVRVDLRGAASAIKLA